MCMLDGESHHGHSVLSACLQVSSYLKKTCLPVAVLMYRKHTWLLTKQETIVDSPAQCLQ